MSAGSRAAARGPGSEAGSAGRTTGGSGDDGRRSGWGGEVPVAGNGRLGGGKEGANSRGGLGGRRGRRGQRDAEPGVLAQRAPGGVVEHRAARGMMSLEGGRGAAALRGMRERDRSSAQRLKTQEQSGERQRQPVARRSQQRHSPYVTRRAASLLARA